MLLDALYLCHSTCVWYIWNLFNVPSEKVSLQNSGSQPSIKEIGGRQKYWIGTKLFHTLNIAIRHLWSGCDDNIRQHEFVGGRIVICRHRSQGQDDGSGNFDPAQCSRVQRWWRSRCCFITPYVAATNLLSTSLWQLLSASRIWSVLIDACGHCSNSFQIFKQKCLPRMLFSAYGLDYQLNERDFLLVEMLDTDVKSQFCSQGL